MRRFLGLAALCGALGCGSSESSNLFSGTGTGSQPGAGGNAAAGASGVGGNSSVGGANSSGSSTGSGGTSPAGGASSGGVTNSGGTGSGGACQIWCRDQDRDQHGDPNQTQTACALPGSGWTTVCDDCDDTEPLVHPGAVCQSTPHTTSSGAQSFDYDCDGIESECGTFAKAGTCAAAGVGVCSGSGYRPNPSRTATGSEDAYCGSTAYQNCVAVGVPCVAQSTTMTAVPCH